MTPPLWLYVAALLAGPALALLLTVALILRDDRKETP